MSGSSPLVGSLFTSVLPASAPEAREDTKLEVRTPSL
jgi:hypothetical protein